MKTWKPGNSIAMTEFREFPFGNCMETMETRALLNFTGRGPQQYNCGFFFCLPSSIALCK